jgi:beta-glucosidase
MIIDEKISCLGDKSKCAPLGVKGSSHVEGIHGLAQGGPGKWEGRRLFRRLHFLKELDWVKRGYRSDSPAEVEGYEARYVFQSSKYNQGGMYSLTKR